MPPRSREQSSVEPAEAGRPDSGLETARRPELAGQLGNDARHGPYRDAEVAGDGFVLGGLLLLGGRLSDLFGARRMFSLGWLILAAGSLLAGLAPNVETELAGRGIQGADAALIAPSAPTLLMMLFGHNPKELTKAFAFYGAAAPAGGTAGVFLGGLITEYASWPWVFYINIPVAILAIAAAPAARSAARSTCSAR